MCGVDDGVHYVICLGKECMHAGRGCVCVCMYMGCVGMACIVHGECTCVWGVGECTHVGDRCVCVCVCLWEGQGRVRNGEGSKSGSDLVWIRAVPDL